MVAVDRPVTQTSIRMLVCIDLHYKGDMDGVMYNRLLSEPYEFKGIIHLIWKMEEIFDTHSFPQVFFTSRTFSEDKPKSETSYRKGIVYMTHQESEQTARGSKGTFLISVQFRQNATWQGSIVWVEKNVKQSFRSALEMIKLMDKALAESTGEDYTVTWKEESSELE